MKTTGQLSEATGISRFTLSQAAREGYLGEAVKGKFGKAYLIDDEHPDYLTWLAKHQDQPRVKGKRKTQ